MLKMFLYRESQVKIQKDDCLFMLFLDMFLLTVIRGLLILEPLLILYVLVSIYLT